MVFAVVSVLQRARQILASRALATWQTLLMSIIEVMGFARNSDCLTALTHPPNRTTTRGSGLRYLGLSHHHELSGNVPPLGTHSKEKALANLF